MTASQLPAFTRPRTIAAFFENNGAARAFGAFQASAGTIQESASTTPAYGVDLARIFGENTNALKEEDRITILSFLNGRLRVNPRNPGAPTLRVVLNEEQGRNVQRSNRFTIEQIIFEMDFTTGHWRRLRRLAYPREVKAAETPNDEMRELGPEWTNGCLPSGWDENGNYVQLQPLQINRPCVIPRGWSAERLYGDAPIYICGR